MIEDKFRSIIPQYRRDPITKEIISQPRSEQITVSPVNPVYVTAELIDEYFRVIIQDMSSQYLIEVFNFDDISEGHFYVNYTSRKIYFDNTSIGIKYNIYYNGMGGEFVDASLISTQIDTAGDVVQTLDDILKGDSIGNLNESWGRATYIQPSNNVLQLTRNRRQYVTNDTLLTGTTVKLPTMELGDYLQLTLMFYADSNLSLVFEDENIKWSSYPNLMGGMTHLINFTYINGEWIAKWEKYDKYIQKYVQDYIFKAGDTRDILTGGYIYYKHSSNDIGASNDGTKITMEYGSSDTSATTVNSIDLTDYAKLYVDLEYVATYGIYKYGAVLLGSTVVWSTLFGAGYSRRIVEIDISTIVGAKKIIFYGDGENSARGRFNIYNAWLEKNEIVDPSQEIFTTSEKNKLIGMSSGANKVIDSTINGNILIDGVETNVYTHPTGTNPHGTTKSDVGLGNVDNTSDLNKPISTATQTALNLKINTSQKGVANGVAQLDSNGIIPSSQLPSYVDDVLEYTSNSLFPTTGESGKIYLNTTNNLTYRWTGSGYAEISPSIALGETSSTAYAGDKGKTTTDNVNAHIINTTNPHNVTKAQVGLGNVDNTTDLLKPISTATQSALNLKVDTEDMQIITSVEVTNWFATL